MTYEKKDELLKEEIQLIESNEAMDDCFWCCLIGGGNVCK